MRPILAVILDFVGCALAFSCCTRKSPKLKKGFYKYVCDEARTRAGREPIAFQVQPLNHSGTQTIQA